MQNAERGKELGNLAGLLFKSAANKWYASIGIEIVAGFIGLATELGKIHGEGKLIIALVIFGMLAIAYVWRIEFEEIYESAETMRRQAVLSEAMDWPVSQEQVNDWKDRAGTKLLQVLKNTHRSDDYYASTAAPGPKRLLEYTLESAFWTRHLYDKLKNIIWICLAAIVVGTALLLVWSTTTEGGVELVQSIFLFLPAILVFDFLEWGLELRRLSKAIKEVELDLSRLDEMETVSESQVLRQVSEYNSRVSIGFPIHSWLFKRWHDEIQTLWNEKTAR